MKKHIATLTALYLMLCLGSAAAAASSLPEPGAGVYDRFLALCKESDIILEQDADTHEEEQLDSGFVFTFRPIAGALLDVVCGESKILGYQLYLKGESYAADRSSAIFACLMRSVLPNLHTDDALVVAEVLMDTQEPTTDPSSGAQRRLNIEGTVFVFHTVSDDTIMLAVIPASSDVGPFSTPEPSVNNPDAMKVINAHDYKFSLPAGWLEPDGNTMDAQYHYGKALDSLDGGYVFARWVPGDIDPSADDSIQVEYLNGFFSGFMDGNIERFEKPESTIIRLKGRPALKGSCNVAFPSGVHQGPLFP